MRPNGAVHVGNDTFLIARSDAADRVYLCTSSFEPQDRLTPVSLQRQIRMRCDSSLHLPGGDQDGSSGAYRYSLHGSPDGRCTAAIAQPFSPLALKSAPPPHFLLMLTEIPVRVCEWRTPSDRSVQSVCWYPGEESISSSHQFLAVLLDNGDFLVYNTDTALLDVTLLHPQRVNCWHAVRQWRLLAISETKGDKARKHKEGKESSALRSASEEEKKRNNKAAVRHSVAERDVTAPAQRNDKEKSSTPPPPPPSLPLAPASLSSLPSPPPVASSTATAKSEAKKVAKKMKEINCFGVPQKDTTGTTATIPQQPPLAPPRASLAFVDTTGASPAKTRAPPHTTSSSSAKWTVASTAVPAVKQTNASAAHGSEEIKKNEDEDNASAGEVVEGVSLTRATSQRKNTAARKKTNSVPVEECPHDHEDGPPPEGGLQEGAEDSIHYIVDASFVPATRSMPPILLLLTRVGDVFSVKTDSKGEWMTALALKGVEKQAYSDGRSVLRHLHAEEERGISGLHYLIKGKGEVEGSTGTHGQTRPSALAVRSVLVDEDTGLHAILILHSTGCVSVTFVDEPQLLSRNRVTPLPQQHRSSADLFPALTEPHCYLHLGPALQLPAVEDSEMWWNYLKISVQMCVMNNVCLIRFCDDAAYLVALPVWIVERHGWSYWRPRNGIPDATEREREMERWSLFSVESAVPDPIALRIPFELDGLSLGLGPREIILAPSTSSDTIPGDQLVISLEVSALLRSSLYAVSVGMRCSFPTGREPDVARPSPPPTSDRRSGATTKKSTVAVDLNMEWEALLAKLVATHAAFLSDDTRDVQKEAMAAGMRQLEDVLDKVEERESALSRREAALRDRVGALTKKATEVSHVLSEWEVLLLDAIAHQRGESTLRTANQRLGEVYAMLCKFDRLLEKAEQRAHNH